MSKCEGKNCELEFEPNSPNQKYAHPSCRKSMDVLGLCKFRKENGIVDIPGLETSSDSTSDAALRVAYSKLLSEYEKVKTKQDEIVSAVYSAVKDTIVKQKPTEIDRNFLQPKLRRITKMKRLQLQF